KEGLIIILIKEIQVRKGRIIASISGRLINAIYELFHPFSYDIFDSSLLLKYRICSTIIKTAIPFIAKLFDYIIIKSYYIITHSYCSSYLRRKQEHKISHLSTK